LVIIAYSVDGASRKQLYMPANSNFQAVKAKMQAHDPQNAKLYTRTTKFVGECKD